MAGWLIVKLLSLQCGWLNGWFAEPNCKRSDERQAAESVVRKTNKLLVSIRFWWQLVGRRRHQPDEEDLVAVRGGGRVWRMRSWWWWQPKFELFPAKYIIL